MSSPRPANPGVFTTRRRRGPGRVLGIIAAIVAVSLAAILFSRLRGDDGAEDGLSSADSVLDAPEDSALEAGISELSAGQGRLPGGAEPVEAPVPEGLELVVLVEPSAASITLDDSISVTAGTAVLVAPGSHTVQASARGYLPVDQTIEVSENDSLRLTLARAPPPTGQISITANLPGRVAINGDDRGTTPLSGLRLRTGTYTLRFVPEAGATLAEERAVEVRAGQTARVAFEIADGLLTVAVREPRWATVYDGATRLGDTPLINRRLPARVYRLRLVRDGYRPRERLAQIAPGGHFQWVDVVLETEVQP